ncbi:MAG: hypothetical protein VX278_21655 [Myxococcota bacterium]|nr:hypothetical protein [Myxococcota bacterium]
MSDGRDSVWIDSFCEFSPVVILSTKGILSYPSLEIHIEQALLVRKIPSYLSLRGTLLVCH